MEFYESNHLETPLFKQELEKVIASGDLIQWGQFGNLRKAVVKNPDNLKDIFKRRQTLSFDDATFAAMKAEASANIRVFIMLPYTTIYSGVLRSNFYLADIIKTAACLFCETEFYFNLYSKDNAGFEYRGTSAFNYRSTYGSRKLGIRQYFANVVDLIPSTRGNNIPTHIGLSFPPYELPATFGGKVLQDFTLERLVLTRRIGGFKNYPMVKGPMLDEEIKTFKTIGGGAVISRRNPQLRFSISLNGVENDTPNDSTKVLFPDDMHPNALADHLFSQRKPMIILLRPDLLEIASLVNIPELWKPELLPTMVIVNERSTEYSRGTFSLGTNVTMEFKESI